MKKEQVDIYYIGSQDCHNSEYVSDYYKLREYVSGFTGSAGSLIITEKEAILWTDGRYFLQAQEQLKDSGFTLYKAGEEGVPTMAQYLFTHVKKHMVIGYDASLLPAKQEENLLRKIKKQIETGEITVRKNITFAADLWNESGTRPALLFQKISLYPLEYAGETVKEKVNRIKTYVEESKKDGYILASLDEIAWLCNLRGEDVPCNPVFFSYFIWNKKQAVLYCAKEQLTKEAEKMLLENGVMVQKYEQFYADLEQLQGEYIADDTLINAKIHDILLRKCQKTSSIASRVMQWKAVKNKVEVEGERQCHIQDGIAMVKFLYWLKKICHFNQKGYLEDENGCLVTELSAAIRLEQERQQGYHYKGASFDPIVACKEHGAIVHYSADETTNIPLQKDTFVLMDTGGQYLEGTTDITRTIALGQVTDAMKQLYTAVLCGNLQLQHTIFKKGARGENLDIVARQPLWRLGYDYNHGTGHGVGCYLNVHEGPVALRFKLDKKNTMSAVLEPGMITSNEPGVYLPGEFGIRLENMLLCEKKKETEWGVFYGFCPLTMVPWDLDAVDVQMMTQEERNMLNAYHKLVFETLLPHLEGEPLQWLKEATKEI